MMMMRTKLFAAATITLGVFAFACDRPSDKASETRTTSEQLTPPAQPAPSPVLPETTGSDMNLNAKDGGHLADPRTDSINDTTGAGSDLSAKDGGHITLSAKDGGHAGITGGAERVGPGHITTPALPKRPGTARGTGEPNSNGSHDMGSGANTR